LGRVARSSAETKTSTPRHSRPKGESLLAQNRCRSMGLIRDTRRWEMENASSWNKMSTSSVCHVHPSREVPSLWQQHDDRSRMPPITPDPMELAMSTWLVRSDRALQRREISRTWKTSSNVSRTPRSHSVSKSLICHLDISAYTATARSLTTGTSRHKLDTQLPCGCNRSCESSLMVL
jgi:hypothetical protein